MSNPSEQHGLFSWAELIANDVPAAKTFYRQVFGWDFQDRQMPDFTYTTIRAHGVPIAGLLPPRPGMPTGWNGYVTVDDVDETARLVEKLGGSIIFGPKDVANVGRFCVIRDPQGAVINIVSYAISQPSSP